MEGMIEKEINKKITDLRFLVLDVMSHHGYPVGEIKISYNCFANRVIIQVQKSEKLEGRTITISEVL
jgi:hypothetical protein